MFTKTKILVWLVVILLVTNISTIVSVFYFSEKDRVEVKSQKKTEVPGEQRARFFKEHLGLQEDQMDGVREANRNYNRQSRRVLMDLDLLREELVEEMTKTNPDTSSLNRISEQIGEGHKQLKIITYSFYLELSAACNDEQRGKLSGLFQSLITSEKNTKLPQRGRGKFHDK